MLAVAGAMSGPRRWNQTEICMGIEDKLVLVVEDEHANATLLALIVERCGLKVEVARDGVEALAMMRQSKPDLVLLDLILPVMRGEEVLDAMGADPVLREVPVLVITTMGGHGDPDECPLPHIRKPFRTPEVRRLVLEALGLAVGDG